MSEDLKELLIYIIEMRDEAHDKIKTLNTSHVQYHELNCLAENLSNIICKANKIIIGKKKD